MGPCRYRYIYGELGDLLTTIELNLQQLHLQQLQGRSSKGELLSRMNVPTACGNLQRVLVEVKSRFAVEGQRTSCDTKTGHKVVGYSPGGGLPV